jgi:hypothetical protein
VTLLAYRLRPLPVVVLTGLPIVLLAAAWWVGPRLGAAEASRLPQFVAVLLGLMTAFSVSRNVDAPEPVLAAAPHPYWRTPGLRVALWLIAAGVVVRLIVDVIEARASIPVPVEALISVAHADLLLVAGLSFVLSVRWGSLMGGAAALIGLVVFAVAQGVWRDWPLRVLDTVGMPRWQQTRAWLLFAGATCVVGGFVYLRARGLPIRHLFIWGRGAKPRPNAQTARTRAQPDHHDSISL